MNRWSAVGYIFCGIGVLSLIIGLFLVMTNANALASSIGNIQYSGELINTLFLGSAAPFLVGCVPMFIIGAVGFLAGGRSAAAPIQKSHRTRTICGFCRTINDIDATYCKKCANRLK